MYSPITTVGGSSAVTVRPASALDQNDMVGSGKRIDAELGRSGRGASGWVDLSNGSIHLYSKKTGGWDNEPAEDKRVLWMFDKRSGFQMDPEKYESTTMGNRVRRLVKSGVIEFLHQTRDRMGIDRLEGKEKEAMSRRLYERSVRLLALCSPNKELREKVADASATPSHYEVKPGAKEGTFLV